MKSYILLITFLFAFASSGKMPEPPPSSSPNSVRLAFLEIYNTRGELVQLEPGGRFAHVAISYADGWLHAYPTRKVETLSTRDLAQYGTNMVIVTLAGVPEPSIGAVLGFLGKAYDMGLSWDDDKIYSSELVGKLLNIPPEPMDFSAPYWPEYLKVLNGKPGLSPDDIFRIVTKNSCRDLL